MRIILPLWISVKLILFLSIAAMLKNSRILAFGSKIVRESKKKTELLRASMMLFRLREALILVKRWRDVQGFNMQQLTTLRSESELLFKWIKGHNL